MKLRRLIELLEVYPGDAHILGADGKHPQDFISYRGYYEQLALVPGDEPTTVKDVLDRARKADGATFSGWKGGDYTMDGGTSVWWSEYGAASGVGIGDPFEFDRAQNLVRIPLFDCSDYQGF